MENTLEVTLWKSFKKRLRNVPAAYIIQRYSNGVVADFDPGIFEQFEDEKEAKAEFKNVIACRDNFGNDKANKESLVAYYESLATFLNHIPEKEIKRLQGSYRADKRRKLNKQRGFDNCRPYLGELHRDGEIAELSRIFNSTKKEAAEKAIDTMLMLASRISQKNNVSMVDMKPEELVKVLLNE